VTPTQVPLSDTETILIGLVVAVAVVPSLTWELVQHFTVMAHEGIHGVAGSLSGRTVEYIQLKDNAEGGTRVVPIEGAGYLVAAFLGYLGPSAFGLGAARLIQFGHIIVILWLVMGLLALLLIRLKWSFGYVTVPLAGFLIFLVLKHTSQSAQVIAAYAITWFLLFSGVRMVIADGANNGDADILNSRTSLPKLLWFGLWLVGTAAAVVIGARWMLHPAVHPPAPSG
jgi:Peptidase M50B-like